MKLIKEHVNKRHNLKEISKEIAEKTRSVITTQ
ncbi:MAG: DUF1059 domain-containing protein [Nitrosotalea sp.]